MNKFFKLILLASAITIYKPYLIYAIDVDSWSGLASAMQSASVGTTITITQDFSWETGDSTLITGSSESVTIDGGGYTITANMPSGSGSVFYIETDLWTIKNLTITGANGGNGTSSSINGGTSAIYISDGVTNTTLNNITISGCTANGFSSPGEVGYPIEGGNGGYIISILGSNSILENLTIGDCQVNGGGGGATSSAGGTGGSGGSGGDIIYVVGSNSTLENLTIGDCQVNGGTGGTGGTGSAGEAGDDGGTGGTGGSGGYLIYITSDNTLTNLTINQTNELLGGNGGTGGTGGASSDTDFKGGPGGTGGTGGTGGSLIYIAGSSNILESSTISSNDVTEGFGGGGGPGGLGPKGYGSTGSNGASGADGYIIYVDSGTENTIVGNTISGNSPETAFPDNVIYLNSSNSANSNQPTFTEDTTGLPTCIVCPTSSGTYNLMVSGTAPVAAVGGTGQLLLQAFFNSSSDEEMNYYAGSTTITASTNTSTETFNVTIDNIDYDESSTFGEVSFTVTNTNGPNSFGTYTGLGDTSPLSEGQIYTTS